MSADHVRRTVVGVLVVALALVSAACSGDDAAAPPFTTTTAATADGEPIAQVAVTVDGDPVALRTVCTGAGGAVVTTSTTGRSIVLVMGEGLVLRVGTGDQTDAETAEVGTEAVPGGIRYSATIELEGDDALVTIDVPSDLALPSC